MNPLLAGMNDKQAEAVMTTEGPLLIMAGAGSGKTRVLTHRVAHLIQDLDVLPWRILAITFTNKAAREMKERISQLVEESDAEAVWVSTFHALAVRILRRDIDKLGYKKDFSIIDASAQRTLIKRILKDFNVDIEKYAPRSVLGAISNAKNAMEGPEEYVKKATGPFEEIVGKAYKEYQHRLALAQSLDFDDLIMLTIELLHKDQEVLSYYQEKFLYVHVDEYQDTNDAQYELVTLLSAKHRNLAVVGDSDQSIYGWRGANMQIILNFSKEYPDAKTVMLEQNYRSTQTILDAANAVIRNNNERIAKKLWTDNGEGEKITYYRGQSDRSEALFVIKEIRDAVDTQQHDYKDFAVLYRTNAQSRGVEEALVKANMPYTVVGGSKFYDRKEIRDVLAYLSLVTNPADNENFLRIVNEPKRGIGQTSLEKLRRFALENNWTLLDSAANATLIPGLSARAANKLTDFAKMISDFIKQMSFDLSLTDLTKSILEKSGYEAQLKKSPTPENEGRLENLSEFLSVTEEFDKNYEPSDESISKYVDFLGELALVSDLDNVDENSNNQITLMTLHAAKGLEFPVVFLVGMEENIFPLSRAAADDDQLEEERRLAYVGITRAKEKLFLTNAYSRLLYGRTTSNPASRFIDEIDAKLIDEKYDGSGFQSLNRERDLPFSKRSVPAQGVTFSGRKRQQPVQLTSQSRPNVTNTGAEKKDWVIGDAVQHKKWGIGHVIKITGDGEDKELDIAFPAQGIKRLLAAFAPISKVEK
ncbi:DNA helicase PcrA [Weissella paramesenteroides]|uniref:ATP-dependent DNA helicase n=1 Tax=Weissella paramesenteroides ATCC 33313 TaxID=585506 RepID=C5RBQ7_WEIPA|nr:DNA helicase PcrA [Weissella paramesenteroides]ATF41172.1 DNA helicase PcrA [Weissella paramesenteroides]EER74397.1 ATP-dependent DNA helicase PcrA [Weissella paramesenteroides ATCC 33313]MBU7557064.1 DNA helicase PcrA [Weissella paramesenteroides]RZQ58213.1 DNA helicase PcrA [Weissella paramesenteroides]TPF02570.1 DNA helicase PcrA [Weissella paramesenteroides]